MPSKVVYPSLPPVHVREEFYPVMDNYNRDISSYPGRFYQTYDEALSAGYEHCASLLSLDKSNTNSTITFTVNKRIRVSRTELADDYEV
jgi:hypothetical protein